jgi:hypothetical protein
MINSGIRGKGAAVDRRLLNDRSWAHAHISSSKIVPVIGVSPRGVCITLVEQLVIN